jgi:hypothetical protein
VRRGRIRAAPAPSIGDLAVKAWNVIRNRNISGTDGGQDLALAVLAFAGVPMHNVLERERAAA